MSRLIKRKSQRKLKRAMVDLKKQLSARKRRYDHTHGYDPTTKGIINAILEVKEQSKMLKLKKIS